jgi:hypothetical protein
LIPFGTLKFQRLQFLARSRGDFSDEVYLRLVTPTCILFNEAKYKLLLIPPPKNLEQNNDKQGCI